LRTQLLQRQFKRIAISAAIRLFLSDNQKVKYDGSFNGTRLAAYSGGGGGGRQ
jgi:hypothetical protein